MKIARTATAAVGFVCASGAIGAAATIATKTGRREFNDFRRGIPGDEPPSRTKFVLMVSAYILMWPVTLPLAISKIREERKQ